MLELLQGSQNEKQSTIPVRESLTTTLHGTQRVHWFWHGSYVYGELLLVVPLNSLHSHVLAEASNTVVTQYSALFSMDE